MSIPKFQVIHGDCRQILPALPMGSVDLIVTSPPYNCRKEYGTDFVDEMSWNEYYQFIGDVLDECYRVLCAGGVLAVVVPAVVRWQAEHLHAHTWSDFDPEYKTHRNGQQVIGKGRIEPVGLTIFEMMRQRDPHIREPIAWVKGSEGNAICAGYQMGCDSDPHLRPAYELVLLGSKERWFHRGGTGRRGRQAVPLMDETKDVWFIPPERNRHHPAVFPVEIPRRLIALFTHAPDAVVLDPFSGMGATGVASVTMEREFVGIEQNAHFVSLSQTRIQDAISQIRISPRRSAQCLSIPAMT